MPAQVGLIKTLLDSGKAHRPLGITQKAIYVYVRFTFGNVVSFIIGTDTIPVWNTLV